MLCNNWRGHKWSQWSEPKPQETPAIGKLVGIYQQRKCERCNFAQYRFVPEILDRY